MSRNGSPQREQRPVFVDASGRRRRGLRVAAAILIAPAFGYVCVLLSTVLGGPTIHSPFLPLPAPFVTVASQHPKPTPTGSTPGDPAQRADAAEAAAERRGNAVLTAPVARLITSAPPVSTPTTDPTKISARKSTPVISSRAKEASGRPTWLPTPRKTAKGKPTSLPTPPRRPIKASR